MMTMTIPGGERKTLMKRQLIGLVVSLVSSAAFATPAGARPDARHAWAVHDEHRPNPPQVETPAGRPPSDAVVLFDGTAESVAKNWCGKDGGATKWVVTNGCFACVPGSGMAQTAESFGDCQLHVEWRIPANDPSCGNSGVYLMGRYEVQILDSYGVKTNEDPLKSDNYADGQAGALYGQNPPLVNASRPAETWESCDIVFHPPHHEGGVETEPATITVFQNGVLVQDNWRFEGPTTWGSRVSPKNDGVEMGPILLQDHGTPVLFRNVWVRRIASPRDNTTCGGPYVKPEDVRKLRSELADRTLAQAAKEKDPVRKMLLLFESHTYRTDESVLARARASEPTVLALLKGMDADACYRAWELVDQLSWWAKMELKAGILSEDDPLVKEIRRADACWRDKMFGNK